MSQATLKAERNDSETQRSNYGYAKKKMPTSRNVLEERRKGLEREKCQIYQKELGWKGNLLSWWAGKVINLHNLTKDDMRCTFSLGCWRKSKRHGLLWMGEKEEHVVWSGRVSGFPNTHWNFGVLFQSEPDLKTHKVLTQPYAKMLWKVHALLTPDRRWKKNPSELL